VAHAIRLALFLTTANINDTDETIETAAKIADNLALLWGGAVIVGVGAEYLLPALSEIGIWNWPGAAVALGVAGEIIFARHGSTLSGVVSDRLKRRLAGAEARAAEANERALDAIGELLKFREPRLITLTRGDMAGFIETMKEYSGTLFDLAISSNDREINDFTFRIILLLHSAGFEQLDWGGAPQINFTRHTVPSSTGHQIKIETKSVGIGAAALDITVCWDTENKATLAAPALALLKALSEFDLRGSVQELVGKERPSSNKTALHIMIGRKG
jgi:hypothetical protein